MKVSEKHENGSTFWMSGNADEVLAALKEWREQQDKVAKPVRTVGFQVADTETGKSINGL